MGAISARGHCPQLRRGREAECSVGTAGTALFSTSYGKKPRGGGDLHRAGLSARCLPLLSLTELPSSSRGAAEGKKGHFSPTSSSAALKLTLTHRG